MTAYVVLIFLMLIAFIYNAVKGKEKGSKKTIIVITIFIIFMQGLRHFDVGVDLTVYEFHFNQIKEMKFIEAFNYRNNESFYFLLNWVLSRFSRDFRIMLFASSILTFVPSAIISYKYSKSPILSIFLFITLGFFTFSLSGLRQTISIGIILISFIFLKERKLFKFVIMVAIASLFHQSGIFFLIAYPVYHFKSTKKYLLVIVPSVLLIFIFRRQIFNVLSVLYDNSYIPVESNAYGFLIGLIVIWIFSLFWFRNIKDNHIEGLLNLLLIAIIIQLFASYHPFVMRLGYYFFVYMILLIPEIVIKVKDLGLRSLSYGFVFLFFSFYFLNTLQGSILEIYPYKFIWQMSIYLRGVY